MKRVKGTPGISLVECINPILNKWAVRWDIQNNTGTTENGEAETGINYMEYVFEHKPDISEIKYLINEWVNQKTNKIILSGFEWVGNPVWLSVENQINYKSAYVLASINEISGLVLPVKFKFGTEDNPVYYEFTTKDELQLFYAAMVEYIQNSLKKGWDEKNTFDYKPYDIA